MSSLLLASLWCLLLSVCVAPPKCRGAVPAARQEEGSSLHVAFSSVHAHVAVGTLCALWLCTHIPSSGLASPSLCMWLLSLSLSSFLSQIIPLALSSCNKSFLGPLELGLQSLYFFWLQNGLLSDGFHQCYSQPTLLLL